MSNFIFISPNFPTNYWQFCRELKNNGMNVLGIGDQPYDELKPELKDSLNEYYKVGSLENYDEVYRAVAFFAFKYGRIDWLESNNEYWLERDAALRTDFNIKSGFQTEDMPRIKYKSKMKEYYQKAGIATARYHMVGDLEKSSFSNIEQQSLEFVKYTLEPWLGRGEQAIQRTLFSPEEKKRYFAKFNVEGLLRGDYASRMTGYATARQNGWMSANDIRELENMDRIPAEEGGDLYLINGNMLPLGNAGAFANTETSNDGKEENPDEEVLEVEEPGRDGDSSGGTDAVPERHHRRGKLV